MKPKPNERGSILIVAVGMLAVLALMAVTFALLSRTELVGSRALTDRQIAEFAAQQGLQTAVEILSKDDPRFDDFAEAWFTPPAPASGAATRNGPNPYHRLVYDNGNRRACYDLNWHINEDPPGDDNADGAPGIRGIDDDGDGKIDEDSAGRVPGDPSYAPNTADDDEDIDERTALGLTPVVDEDGFTPDSDGRPGVADRDDDADGQVDEDSNGYVDSDGDGQVNEDPGISTGALPYKDTPFTRNNTDANYVNDDILLGDALNNENQSGKCFQPVSVFALPRGISFTINAGRTYTLDYYMDGRVWEDGYGDLQLTGTTGGIGITHLDENLDGAADNTSDIRGGTGWALWTGDPMTKNFVTYAGGRLGCNRQDDDEDSDGRIRTTYAVAALGQDKVEGNEADGMILDEGGKINLNAHGSLYDPAFFDSNARSYLDGTMKLDSFRVSLVRFFQAYGLNGQTTIASNTCYQARGLARAIILYRYGKDMKPGLAGIDDDGDRIVSRNGTADLSVTRGLVSDNGLDDNGNWTLSNDTGLGYPDGTNNLGAQDGVPSFMRITPDATYYEPNSTNVNDRRIDEDITVTATAGGTDYSVRIVEGVDDDREFDPINTKGDDRPYTSIEQMIDALVWGTTSGLTAPPFPTDDRWVPAGTGIPSPPAPSPETRVMPINQPLGVGYILDSAGNVAVDVNGDGVMDIQDVYAEATRIFNIVREDISVNVADLDIGKVNINVDQWGWDGMDNDNNGLFDLNIPTAARGSFQEGVNVNVGREAAGSEEDTRTKCGAEKVAVLKRAFRRAFGAHNAPFVDTIAINRSNGRTPEPFYEATASTSGNGVLVGPEVQGPNLAFNLVGDPRYYINQFVLDDPSYTMDMRLQRLGRALRDQMWANIVDSQDDDFVPTMLVCDSLYPNFIPPTGQQNEYSGQPGTGLARVENGNVDIFGVEGLHLNEVMIAPEIAGSSQSKTRTNPPSAIEPLPPTNPTLVDTPVYTPTTDAVTAYWKSLGDNRYELTVEKVTGKTPPATTTGRATVTGEWRIKGIPRGAYVVMAYGDGYLESGRISGAGYLEVSFPAADGTNRNGIVILTPAGNTQQYDTNNNHILDISKPNHRNFFVPVTRWFNETTSGVLLKDEVNPPTGETYGFVTRPDYMDNTGIFTPWAPFHALRVDADPETGFLIHVRAVSRWQYNSTTQVFTPGPAHFNGLRFICPFVEFVNISKRPIPLGEITTYPDGTSTMSNPWFRLLVRSQIPTGNWASVGGTLGTGAWTISGGAFYNPKRITSGGGVSPGRDTAKHFPAAHADTQFPPNFGYYVVALSEAAYAGSFGANSFSATLNGGGGGTALVSDYYTTADLAIISNVTWGEHSEEAYAVQFTEAPSTTGTTDHEKYFGLWNRDWNAPGNTKGMFNNPIALLGDGSRSQIWPSSIKPNKVLIAGGEIDLWAGGNSPRGTRPIDPNAVPLDYFSIEKTAPVVPNIASSGNADGSPRPPNQVMAQFMPVNPTAPLRFYTEQFNAAWMQIDPNSNKFQDDRRAGFPTTDLHYGQQLWKNLWWRSSQRNLWHYTSPDDASVLLRKRLSLWNKNYMYMYDGGAVNGIGRKYLWPGHFVNDPPPPPPQDYRDDIVEGEIWNDPDPSQAARMMDLIELRMAKDNRTVPVVLDDAFPAVGWLAFVHSELGPWKNLTPIPPEERVGENDLGYLFGGGDPGHGMAYPVYFDDNILTRLIGLSGGVHISYAAGGLNNNYSFRPTAFTVYIDGIGSMGGRHALRSVTDPTAPGLPVPGVYRSTVFQRCPTSPPFGGPERTPDWREIATVWPHGRARARININTASMPVLAAVFNTTTAADIIRFRPYRDICDVLGYSGFVGYEGPTAVETSEIRRRFIPSACRPITSPNAIVQRLRQDRRLPTGSVNDQQELFRGDPFFTKNAYYTLFAAVPIDGASAPVTTRDTVSSPAPGGGGAWLVTCHPPLDYDDSGAGRLYDDLADDVGERMEWFSRYWDVIDIKSRFFTVIARGRAFDPTKLVGDARVRAIVERQDIINNLNGMRMTTSGARGLPTPGADGITDAVKVLSSRFITEY